MNRRSPKRGASRQEVRGMTALRLQTILVSSLDSLLEGVQIIDPEWRYLYVNAKAAEHGRANGEVLVGRTMHECYPGIEKTPLFAELQHVMQTGDARRLQNEFEYADGRVGFFELRVTRVPEGICIFSLDVTEQERARASLSHREAELRIIADNVRDLLFLASPSGQLLYVNPAFERVLGYRRNELLAMEPRSLLHPDDGSHLENWAHVPHAEFRLRCSNGTWKWMEGFCQEMAHSQDGLVAGVLRDITERRIMEEVLSRNEERTRFAMRAAKMGVWELDELTGNMWWSETLEDVCRLRRGTWPKTWDEFTTYVCSDDLPRLRESLQEARGACTDFHVEFRFIPPDKKLIWLQGWARFVYDASGKAQRLLGVGIDVTERRAIELQFQQAQKAEAIGRLAGGVAHDFNNLLTVISGFSELVAEGFLESDPRREDIAEVLAAAERAKVLTRQLLAFSRKQILQPTTTDLNRTVRGMERLLGRVIGEDIRLDTRLSPEPCLTFVDVHQIEQAILNLVVNARDAMPQGGVLRIDTHVQSFAEPCASRDFVLPAGRYVVLTVSDTGVGMDESTRSKVFEPFFTTKGTKGTGLGLASVYGCVKQLGGFITVYSEPGLGATFKIYFPNRHEPVQSVAAPELSRVVQGTERILVVEDDEAVRGLIVKHLRQLGYQTLVAQSPAEAYQLITSGQEAFDLLLTDIVMPGTNGIELVRRIRQAQPELRVLFISGYSEDSLSAFNIGHPNDALLQKPFDSRALAVAVRRALSTAPCEVPGPRR